MGKKKGKRWRGSVALENLQGSEQPVQNDATESQAPTETNADDNEFARSGSTRNDSAASQQIREVNEVQLQNPGNLPNVDESVEQLQQTTSGEKYFDVGDVIFDSTPLVYVLLKEQKEFRCDRCLYRRQTLVPCDKCHFVSYCSLECKEIAWKNLHRYECKMLKIRSSGICDNIRFLGLLIMVLKNPKTSLIADQVQRFNDLKPREEMLQNAAYRLEIIKSLYVQLKRYLGSDLIASLDEYKTIYSKSITATMNIVIRGEDEIGLGLYLRSAVLQHSCVPTACYTFAGPIMRVTCVEEIPRNHEKLVTISRARVTASGQLRRMILKNKHTLECSCRRCTDPEFEVMTKELLDEEKAKGLHSKINELIGSSDNHSWTEMQLNEFINTCESLLWSISEAYGPFHFKRALLLQFLVFALFDAGHFDKCEVWIPKYLAVYEYYFDERNPRLASILFLLVQVEMFLGNRTLAKNIMIEALQLTCICYGSDHPFYTHMESVYQHCDEMNWNMSILIKSYPRYLDEF